MKLLLKPTDLGHGPIKDDFTVYEEDRAVIGRIYLAREVATPSRWFWTNNRSPNRPTDRGFVQSLEAAKAAFKTAWEKP